MLYSMTGIREGRHRVSPVKKITVEIKSLNSKQIDIAARVPSSLRAQELEMRNHIAALLERGKVDMTVYVENVAGDASVKLNAAALKAYKDDVEATAKGNRYTCPSGLVQCADAFPGCHEERDSCRG